MSDNMPAYLKNLDYTALLQNAIRIAIIIVVALIIWWAIRLFISRLVERLVSRADKKGEGNYGSRERAETIGTLLRKVVGAIYWIMILLTLLSQVGVNIGALIAGAGIFGLAFAFGAQQLVKNYVTGFFIVLENQISVGDIAIVNGTWGTVETINFRTTVLRSADGIVHVFSNGDIRELANATKGWGGYMFKIGVAHSEDTERVIGIIRKVGDEMKQDPELGKNMLEDMAIHGVHAINDDGYVIRGLFKTTPMNQWATGRAFLGRLKDAFHREGVQMPSPHRTLNFGVEGSTHMQIEAIGQGSDSQA